MKMDPEGIERSVLHQLVDLADSTVLEVGSGDGRLIRVLAESARHVIGIDPDTAALESALFKDSHRDADSVHYSAAMCETLPFPNGVFDGVLFGWSL